MHPFFSRSWPAAAVALMAGIFIVPLWCVYSPGMPDYPAHVAGFHLIAGGVPRSAYYYVHWLLVPNLASELVVPLLAHLMPVEIATKLFLSAAVAMWVVGPSLIHRALFGRFGVAPLAGALFVYNANFTWGFFNYYFAAGLSFLVFAAWIATAERRTPAVLGGFAIGIFALYIFHLFGMLLLLAYIGSFELTAALRARPMRWQAIWARLWPVAAIFAPALFAFLFFKSAGGEGGGIEFNYADSLGDRFGSAAQWYFSEPAYLLIGGLAIGIFAGLAYGRLRIHPAVKLLVMGLAILTLVAPEWALGGWGVDMRLPAVLGALTFASLELRLSRPALLGVAVAAVIAALGNATALTADWAARDRQYSEFRQALRSIPEGTRIFTVLDGDALNDISDPPYWHMAEFAIVDRGGFTPLMFTTKGQHVIQLRSPYDKLAAATAQQGSPPDATELTDLALGRDKDDPDVNEVFPYLKFFQCHYNMAVVVHGGGEQADVPDFMSVRHAGSFFTIYDIHPTGICANQ
jgi:hypothetical protein